LLGTFKTPTATTTSPNNEAKDLTHHKTDKHIHTFLSNLKLCFD